MARDPDPPELEIQLMPDTTASRPVVAEPSPGDREATRGHRPSRWLLLCVVAIVAALVVTSLVLRATDSEDSASPTTLRGEPNASTIAIGSTVRTPTPTMLGAKPTGLSLWTFDADSRLQVLDLDSGQQRNVGVPGDRELIALSGETLVIWGANSAHVIDTNGETLRRRLGDSNQRPIPMTGTGQLWVLSGDMPRRWQLHHPDGGLITEVPHDPFGGFVHFNERAVLLTTGFGTSRFDIQTRQTELITTTNVIAASGGAMIGRRCSGDLCTLTAIDVETRRERLLRADLPVNELPDAMLSPDGRHLALAYKSASTGRFVEIFDVADARAAWRSQVGLSYSGDGPAWSWSPDSTLLFVAMSEQHVIAVSVRAQPLTHTDLALTIKPYHGLAATQR